MNITTVGIDRAKDIITVYAHDKAGHCVMSRNFKFKELAEWLVQLPEGYLIGMEACSSAHHWGRRMQATGLHPRLMAAEFVQAFRKSKSAKFGLAQSARGLEGRTHRPHQSLPWLVAGILLSDCP